MSQKTTFHVGGIFRSSQADQIRGLKQTLLGIQIVQIDQTTKIVEFEHNPSTTAADIEKALKDLGLTPTRRGEVLMNR